MLRENIMKTCRIRVSECTIRKIKFVFFHNIKNYNAHYIMKGFRKKKNKDKIVKKLLAIWTVFYIGYRNTHETYLKMKYKFSKDLQSDNLIFAISLLQKFKAFVKNKMKNKMKNQGKEFHMISCLTFL